MEEEIEMEVEEIIRILKKGKAPGEDGIASEAWIYGREETVKAIAKVIKEVWEGKELPKEWKGGIIKPIYKKGCRDDVENYRGITLMDTTYKIYAEWIRRRLNKEIEEKGVLDKTQFGFRKGKGTAEAIYVVSEIIEKRIRKEKGKLFVCFADLKAAFDKVKRK